MSKIIELKLFKLPRKIKPAKKRKVVKKKSKTTYIRKYYLHRRIKNDGFSLHLETCQKTINVPIDLTAEAKENKYILELQQLYSYGIQLINPIQ